MKNHLWPLTTLESKHQTNMAVPRTRLKTVCLNHSDKQKEISCKDQNIPELQSPMNIILHLEGRFTVMAGPCVYISCILACLGAGDASQHNRTAGHAVSFQLPYQKLLKQGTKNLIFKVIYQIRICQNFGGSIYDLSERQ